MFKMTEEQLAAHNKKMSESKVLKPVSQLSAPVEIPKLNIVYKDEHHMQTVFVRYVNLLSMKCPALKLGFAVPNGGMRHMSVAKKLKAEGVKSGVPDWHLPVARKIYKGFWLEFKHGKNKPTENQIEFIAMLRKEGHFVEICYSADEALGLLMRYMDLKFDV